MCQQESVIKIEEIMLNCIVCHYVNSVAAIANKTLLTESLQNTKEMPYDSYYQNSHYRTWTFLKLPLSVKYTGRKELFSYPQLYNSSLLCAMNPYLMP